MAAEKMNDTNGGLTLECIFKNIQCLSSWMRKNTIKTCSVLLQLKNGTSFVIGMAARGNLKPRRTVMLEVPGLKQKARRPGSLWISFLD